MKKLTLLLSIALLVSTSAMRAQQPAAPEPGAQAQAQKSQSWSGNLTDAACKKRDASNKCPVTGTTSSYGVTTSDGKFYSFDDAGNSATRSELAKAGSRTGEIAIIVTGTLDGDMIKVQTVQLQ